MNLVITDTIFDEFPELVLGVVILHNIDNSQNRAEITEILRQVEAALPGKFASTPVIEHPYIATWHEAYRKFGAKPKDYPSSVENLTRRVLNGATIRHINNLVTLYNTVSLRYILPVGVEDLDKIVGDIQLTRASNDEPAVFLLGEKEARTPRAGEVIYKDEVSAICRRWNWKEADRTKLTEETQHALLVIEALPPVPRATVETAIHELADVVERYCGGTASTAFLDKAIEKWNSASHVQPKNRRSGSVKCLGEVLAGERNCPAQHPTRLPGFASHFGAREAVLSERLRSIWLRFK